MIHLEFREVAWPMRRPFRIARQSYTHAEALQLILTDEQGHVGRGEALGVDYHGESVATMRRTVESWWNNVGWVESTDPMAAFDGNTLRAALPPGGARNLIDTAAWDLRAKQTGVPAWKTAGLDTPPQATTAFTLGIGTEDELQSDLERFGSFKTLKLKADRNDPRSLVERIHNAAPQAGLILDANAAWRIDQLQAWSADLADLGVTLIEQPLDPKDDTALTDAPRDVPLAADESCDGLDSLTPLIGKYDAINIKLDKCGGLTEALLLADAAQDADLRLMIGCMSGSSLAMAPAMMLAPRCDWVDLDGPLLQSQDIQPSITIDRFGRMSPPQSALWG